MNKKNTPHIYLVLLGIFLLTILLAGGVPAAKTSKKEIIKLPTPKITGKMSLEQAIKNRRSSREYLPTPISDQEISQLLWAAQGITDPEWDFRAAPSAGALYPLEIYVIKPDGIFHYLPKTHTLEKISSEDRRKALAQASLGQSFVAEVPLNIVIGANFYKVRPKYGSRAERYVFIEAGHVAENIQLQAVALGLGTVPLGAFWDDIIKRIILLPSNIYPLYIIPVGYPK